MNLTEAALFEYCVDKPKSGLVISNLNLTSLHGNYPSQTMDKSQATNSKLAKQMFHMVWSGVTKFLKTTVIVRCKSAELTDIGIIVPVQPAAPS